MNKELTLGQQFLASADKFPEHDALVMEEATYSYKTLKNTVRKWYNVLRDSNCRDHRIGVYFTNDLDSYAALLAISVYGGSFVPLNPDYPASRLHSICKEAGIKVVLNVTDNDFGCQELNADASTVDSIEMPPVVIQPGSYVMFTSGTTGGPKGVEINHEHINSFFDFVMRSGKWDFDENDRVLQAFELSFDMSIFSLFLPLISGGCSVVVPLNKIRFVEIAKALSKNNITVVILVPTVLNFLLPYVDELDLTSVRFSFFAGDKLLHSTCTKWAEQLPNAEIVNMYGPTETTIASTYYPWNPIQSAKDAQNDIVPIGLPFNGVEYLIDEEELCMRGSQVISAYLNEANEEKFLNTDRGRFYRTGDLVAKLENGNLIFKGRKDHQIKLNGYRIELNELNAFIGARIKGTFYLHPDNH